MKPMHGELVRLSRCPCCQSVYSRQGNRRKNTGKTATRHAAKMKIRKELNG